MTAVLLFILLVIIAAVAMAIFNQNKVELGSRAEDILLEQARVAELKAELEQAGIQEREELTALRLEMQILEKENAKNVLTLEKELIASGLKGKEAEDALRKELEETRLAEQAKVAAIQLQLDKAKTQEQAKVKSIQSELDKSQARIGLMEANVKKLKNKPVAEIADLKKKLSEAMVSTRDAQEKANAQASLVKAEKSESAKQLKVIQDELNTLKQLEADKRKTLNAKLGDSTDTIEDLEEEIAYLKSQAATFVSEKAAAEKAAADKKAAAEKAAAEKAAAEKAAADKIAAEKAAAEKAAAEKAAAEKAAADKIAAEKAVAEKAAAEKAAAKKAAAEKAAAEKAAAEKAAAQKKADDRAKILAIAAAVKKAYADADAAKAKAAAEKAAREAAAAKKAAEEAAAALFGPGTSVERAAWMRANCEPCHRIVRCEPPTNECYGCFGRNKKKGCPLTWEPCPDAPPGACPK